MRWLWICGALLFLVAAAAIWVAFQRPDFVAGLVAIAIAAAWKAMAPALAKDFSPERAKEVSAAVREGRDPEWRGKHGHAGENH